MSNNGQFLAGSFDTQAKYPEAGIIWEHANGPQAADES